jgi:hypothetical protein
VLGIVTGALPGLRLSTANIEPTFAAPSPLFASHPTAEVITSIVDKPGGTGAAIPGSMMKDIGYPGSHPF